jgi:L-threonylcarbamoyladenylate synthase
MPIILSVDAIERAAQLIGRGLVVAYPTDTLYGLAVDPRNAEAVRRLFALKGRAETSALTLIAADYAQAAMVMLMSPLSHRLAKCWWPGPLTIVAAAAPGLAAETLAGGNTVGVRVPGSSIATALAAASGFCITATSANRSGAAAASTPEQVAAALPDVDAILGAEATPGGPPSTIVNATGDRPVLIRAGAVAWDRVLESLQ